MSAGTLKSRASDGPGSAVGSYTRRWMARERPGRNGLPDHRADLETAMSAIDSTPGTGENVSDEPPTELSEVHAQEVWESIEQLQKSARTDVDWPDVLARVKEVRARMRYLERMIEDGGVPSE